MVATGMGYLILAALEDRRDDQGSSDPRTIAGVQSFADLARTHVSEPVAYPQTPPVGGPHTTAWQNCGFYQAPVADETGVHSLEHGAVWITYRPGLPPEQMAKLCELGEVESYVLVSPYPSLPAPVVVSAWGKQLTLDSAMDTRLDNFVHVYQQGSQTLEPGAPCSGGSSETSG